LNNYIESSLEIQKKLYANLRLKYNILKSTNNTGGDFQYNVNYDISDNDMSNLMKE